MPYVKWMMGADELTKEDEMPVGRNVLELSNVVRSANYTCVAISSLGMIEATAQVTVKGKCSRYMPCCRGILVPVASEWKLAAVGIGRT
jgi:hypothetical protein